MINPISSITQSTPSDVQRKRVDRFDFPIARSSFETAPFVPSHAPSTLYEKTLKSNLLSTSITPIIPHQKSSPPPISPWPIQRPFQTCKVTEVPDDFYLDPLTIFQKTLFIAAKKTFEVYSSKTLQSVGTLNLNPDWIDVFLSIKANPSFPLISFRTAPLGKRPAFGSLLMYDIETGKFIDKINLTKIASENDKGRGSCISWRNAWEVITPMGYGCLQIDRREEYAKIFSLGKSSDGTLCGIASNQDGQFLATGSSAGAVRIYDMRSLKQELFHYAHGTSSVKALAWHPSLPLLASGGANQDYILKVINLNDQTLIKSQDTKAQIISLIWLSKKHILTGYGYGYRERLSNLGVHHLQSRSITSISHPSHPSIASRRVWTIKDPSTERGLSYYTLNGSKGGLEAEGTQLSKWLFRKEDALKQKVSEMVIR